VRPRLPSCEVIIGVLQQGQDLLEGRARLHEGNHGRLRLEPVAEPLEKDVDKLAIRHRIA
jgi:hypothetical protein